MIHEGGSHEGGHRWCAGGRAAGAAKIAEAVDALCGEIEQRMNERIMLEAVACEIFHLPLRVMSAKSSTLSEVHRLIGLFGCLPSRSLRKLLLGMPASRSPLQRNSF